MKKCKIAAQTPCEKEICCFECEEKDSCNDRCGYSTSEGCDNLIDTDAMDETKAIEKFQEEKKDLITQIARFKKQMDEMENQKKELHEQLEKAMELYGVKSIVTGDIRITYTAAHTSKKFSFTAAFAIASA